MIRKIHKNNRNKTDNFLEGLGGGGGGGGGGWGRGYTFHWQPYWRESRGYTYHCDTERVLYVTQLLFCGNMVCRHKE